MPIALLTDFGLMDSYVGVMRGVILGRAPGAVLFDLTHGVPPQDVRAGALQLLSAAPYCPADTIFLAVVDPGVGGERRPICLRAGTRLFVGPDNGLLWPAAAHFGEVAAWDLRETPCGLPQRSATFHGRDLFAPVAAALALGTSPDRLGVRIPDPAPLHIPVPTAIGDEVVGEALLVDGYGNVITNIKPEHLPAPTARFHAGDAVLTGPASHYAAVPPGEPLVVLGSLGYYEIAVNGGSAAATLGLEAGQPVRVSR